MLLEACALLFCFPTLLLVVLFSVGSLVTVESLCGLVLRLSSYYVPILLVLLQVKWAMVDVLKRPPVGFEEVVKRKTHAKHSHATHTPYLYTCSTHNSSIIHSSIFSSLNFGFTFFSRQKYHFICLLVFQLTCLEHCCIAVLDDGNAGSPSFQAPVNLFAATERCLGGRRNAY